MTAISSDYLESLPTAVPRGMTPESAIRELLDGHRSGHYELPVELVRVADGTADLVRAYRESSQAYVARYQQGWELTLAGSLAAQVRGTAWATGRSPKDPAEPLLAAHDEELRLRYEVSVLGAASRSAETAPETVARSKAAAIGDALETARAEVLEAAAGPAQRIARLDLADPGALLGAPKAAQAAYTALEALVPRFGAILAAAGALAVLSPADARTWPPVSAGHPVAELAKAAT